MKKLLQAWASFPAAHKKRLGQALGVYILIVAIALGLIELRAQDTLGRIDARTPSATAQIKDGSSAAALPAPAATATTDTPAAANGKTPDTAAAPAQDDGKTYVSIIVGGLGLSTAQTSRAISGLPAEISLAFSPYADDVTGWVRKALAAKHETLMMLPMETASYPQEDPGPRTLSSRFSDAENEKNLEWILKAGQGAAGAINFMGSRFMTDTRHLTSLFAALRKREAFFIETPGLERSAAPEAADKTGLPYLAAEALIDASATEKDIRAQLEALEKSAVAKGYAVGIAQPYPLTFTILKSWAAELPSRGITLAPLGTVLQNKPTRHDPKPPQPKQ